MTPRKYPGLFIVVEGSDGSGKGTQLSNLRQHLTAAGVDFLATADPGSTELGLYLRKQLSQGCLSPTAEIFGFAAARAQMVETMIRPALEQGRLVICDRYALSTVIYQGLVSQNNLETITRIAAMSECGVQPDAYFVFTAPAEVLAERRGRRASDETWSFEQKTQAEIAAVGYQIAGLLQQGLDTSALFTIDATPAPDAVWQVFCQQFHRVFDPWYRAQQTNLHVKS